MTQQDTQPPAETRDQLTHDEQMQDAQKGCVPCILCGGHAIIADAGVGAGYHIRCSNSTPFRKSSGCLIDERTLGGWAYNCMDWWNRLHTAALTRRAGGDAIPAGWQLVPVEPIDAMREAATGVPISSMIGTPNMVRIDYDEADAIWSAMRAASPKPPAGGDAGAVRDALLQAVGALQPFADADEGDAEDADHMAVWPTFTVGDLRRAVDAVKEGTAALALPAPVVEGE